MTDEEFKKESLVLLKQSNEGDYLAALKKINEKAGRELSLDTPIELVTGYCNGFEANGLTLNGLVKIKNNVIIVRFDRPMRTKREGGEAHASLDIYALGRCTVELEERRGEHEIMNTTLGDKETFCKIVNNMWDITDEHAYLVKDPRELLCKKDKIDPNMEPELDEFGHRVHYVDRCAPGTHLGEYHEVWARFWKTPGGKWDVCVYKMKFEDGHVVEWGK